MHHPRPRRLLVTAVAVAALATSAAACGSSSSDGAATPTTKAAGGDGTQVTTEQTEPPSDAPKLEILVSNDDGYAARGISTLVDALTTLPNVHVTVVAPLTQQSGTGGKTTEGKLAVTDVTVASGFAAKAVAGYPSDAVNTAFDVLGLKPDVVITGINEGQNLGPAVDASGTVGAARAAAAHGVPALATSQGAGKPVDYESATPFITDWLEDHRAALAAHSDKVQVTNLNVPSCAKGKLRGLLEIPPQLGGDFVTSLGAGDCSSTKAKADLVDDVTAFLNGYATIDVIPST